jgi:hypothetical protein
MVVPGLKPWMRAYSIALRASNMPEVWLNADVELPASWKIGNTRIPAATHRSSSPGWICLLRVLPATLQRYLPTTV